MTKELINNTERKIIKVGVILGYGEDNARLISSILKSENTEDKLNAIHNIDNLTITSEQKLFVIQKLLSYPKSVRVSIANQIESRLS